MATALNQAGRTAAVVTPLGDNAFVLLSLRGTEECSRLFEYELKLLTKVDQEVDPKKLLGRQVLVTVVMTNGNVRKISGIMSALTQLEAGLDYKHFSATIVPEFWALTRRAKSMIYQQISASDIIKQALAGLNVTYSFRGTYEPRNYCTQYRETDFNFVSRMLEEEGVNYRFDATTDAHTMVVFDDSADCPESITPSLPYNRQAHAAKLEYCVWDLTIEKELQPGLVTLWDHTFELPHKNLEAKKPTLEALKLGDNDKLEIYDYPGEYAQRFDGVDPGGGDRAADVQKIYQDNTRTAGLRMEEYNAQFETIYGYSNSPGIVPGTVFKLTDHPDSSANRKYVVTAATYNVDTGAYGTSDSGGEKESFQCRFAAIPATVPLRPARVTPKPVVHGAQTADVVGASGEEVFVDKYGRVKCQFHWDRLGKQDANSSCWIRVAQSWAGKKWGSMFIPRVGMEVVVDFLEGDPDRPLVVGCVYNAENMPAYRLPDKKTVSSLKTNSSKGGGGFNELRFEDLKGSEEIFIHAEKDLQIQVKNNRNETVVNDRHLEVKHDKFEHVENNRNETVDKDHKEKIGKDRHLDVVGKEAKGVTESLSLKVGGDVIEEFKSNHSEVVTKDYYLKADNIVIEGLTNVTIKVGKNSIVIEKSGISIKCDEASAPIDVTAKMGITLESSTDKVGIKSMQDTTIEATANFSAKGTAGVAIESTANASFKGSLATVEATGILTVKGAMVNIN